ncbi:hypothetical protein [Vibrio coralliilyticus]|uniref:Uncharacterized protein n=1 Tax=Vibrio coralliilyticus TaxID=190893 RepID=A0AAP6ZVC7_9VIBR|nr:hypothetical protein [Vibrio coralliilyticus]NOI32254.1 hypothetical protein [Vibrio coralliilyticus]NOJ25338.1 hypothetical protein [Vibrio coralliilyticus]
MSDTTLICFGEYKSDYSFYENEDLFLDSSQYGCHETEFEKWLKTQRLFIKRYSLNLVLPLYEMLLPLKKWRFFSERFEREMQNQFLVSEYPEGFFEAEDEDGQVAAFLPDTYGKMDYRISFYRANGPTYHETYETRQEALKVLANRKFIAKEGALDALVGTSSWNRGIYICSWIQEGISPMEGLLRDRQQSEVQQLFADELLQA